MFGDTLGVNSRRYRARYRVEPCKFSTRKFYGMQNASTASVLKYIFWPPPKQRFLLATDVAAPQKFMTSPRATNAARNEYFSRSCVHNPITVLLGGRREGGGVRVKAHFNHYAAASTYAESMMRRVRNLFIFCGFHTTRQ